MSDETKEKLAAYAHEAWSGWMEYLFSKCEEHEFDEAVVIPSWAEERWKRQMETPYADLPESEKESDRAEADKMLALFDTELYRLALELNQKSLELATKDAAMSGMSMVATGAPRLTTGVELAHQVLEALTPEQRLEAFSDYCTECGDYDPKHRCCCQCR